MTTNAESNRPSLAVVLPVLNEAAHLATSVRSLRSQTEPAEQLLVVDGGSTDGTETLARSLGCEVLSVSGRGRGGQIAMGVSLIQQEIVVIAHADMGFPADALAAVRDHLRERLDCAGGCLGHRFRSSGWMLRVIEWFDRRRAMRGMSYGDQCQFFRRELLTGVGGFPDQPIMEDIELSRRLRQLGDPTYLDLPVTVSARRFERRGVFRVLLENWIYRKTYRSYGRVACRSLYRRYYQTNEGSVS